MSRESKQLIPLLVLATVASAVPAAWAAWPSDPTINVPLCTAQADQRFSTIVSDGAGGAIVAWTDQRDTIVTRSDIYIQRVSAGGVPLWNADGVALCTALNDQTSPAIVSDGEGGAIVAWTDSRSGTEDMYAQRVNATGVPQWTADGVALCAAAGNQFGPTIIEDGAGGAIVAWADGRSGNYQLYAQRVNTAGVPQWTADGVAICTASVQLPFPAIASDAANGAIVSWQDFRSGTSYDIYAQRVDAGGTPQWTADGVALCTLAGYQQFPSIVPDGLGGALIAWMDGRAGSVYDIFAQRVNAAGAPQWAANGVALCSAANNQYYPKAIADGAGGAIVTWQDNRSGTSHDIYAQRVNASGAAQWAVDGVALCSASGYQSSPAIISDGAGGAIVTWEDARSGGTTHIYARSVNAVGVPQWTADGIAVAAAANGQFSPAIAPDGAGGAIVAWDDIRGTSADIYAQNINADGSLGGPVAALPHPPLETLFGLRGAEPNPSAGELRVSFSLPDASPATLELLDLTGRRIVSQSVGNLGAGAHVVPLAPQVAALPPGIYGVKLTQGSRRAFSKVAVVR
jgi:hypothetical protein